MFAFSGLSWKQVMLFRRSEELPSSTSHGYRTSLHRPPTMLGLDCLVSRLFFAEGALKWACMGRVG